jgi:NAD(P)-dependent dehydrogenase (short-subunit alcohol dehydrogenase family)
MSSNGKGVIMGKLLEGRVAVVTGSGNGIGRAEAIGLARHGAKVVVNDIGTSYDGRGSSYGPADATVKEIADAGGVAVPNYDSVTTLEGAQRIIQTAIDSFGRIDVLINNAGVVRDPQNVAEVSPDDWEILIKTHLYGTFYCTRSACVQMKRQGYGRIVNTSSHVGLGWKGFASYGAAKEGIAGFTRTVARDMAEFGITCNAIRPLAAWRGSREISPEMALNRPEDVASLVVYLASEPAGHINGRIFEVWHGHVGIFEYPPPVQQSLNKKEGWTTEELAERIPQTLTKGLSREDFPRILEMF